MAIDEAEAAFPLFVATGPTTVGGTTRELTLLGDGTGLRTLPAGRLRVGDTIHAALSGHLTTGAARGVLVVSFWLNDLPILETTAMPIPPECSANPWRLQIAFGCQRAGDEGRAVGMRIFSYLYAPKMPLSWVMIQRDATELDTRAGYKVDITAQWSEDAPANTITCEEALLELVHGPLEETIHMA